MKAEFIAIGTELLTGGHVESNSLFVQSALAEVGILLHRKSVIPDDINTISSSIKEAAERADLVICSGGLGPTVDDMTTVAAAAALERKVKFQEGLWLNLKKQLEKRGRKSNEGNRKQFDVVEEARILKNEVGQAPGQFLEWNERYLVLLPGVPKEMSKMLEREVVPLLKDKFSNTGSYRKLVFKFAAIPESDLDGIFKEKFNDVFPLSDEQMIITTKPGVQTLTLFFKSNDDAYKKRTEQIEKLLSEQLPEYFFGSEEVLLEEALGEMLIARWMRVSTAESCTGGFLASRLTDIPGASEYFTEGMVVYHNDAKIEKLGVLPQTLERYGAVSEQVAAEMALGLIERAGTEITASITGIAGPTGGSDDKPVGTVYIGIADRHGCDVSHHVLSGNRRFFKEWVTSLALNRLRLRLLRFH